MDVTLVKLIFYDIGDQGNWDQRTSLLCNKSISRWN